MTESAIEDIKSRYIQIMVNSQYLENTYPIISNMIYPIGSMHGIYANIWGILMGSMLPYIAAPWILWVLYYRH